MVSVVEEGRVTGGSTTERKSTVAADDSLATDVAEVLRDGLEAARRAGAKSVQATHLSTEQFETLAASTLAHLRSRPGKPSPIEGWSLVSARSARLLSWWAEAAGLTEAERRRLGPLRHEVYELLAEQNLIETDPSPSASVHVSPAPRVTTAAAAPEQNVAEPAGAWILRLSPHVYDVNRVFAAPDRQVRLWSVEDDERSASMKSGQPVYLWVSEGDPFREAGVWGVGWIAGPCIRGIADEGWLDHEAASRAELFAVVEITLLDSPVRRETFLDDVRLADAEVIREPYGPNPGVISPSEAEALAEHLSSLLAPSVPRVVA